jgi:hypothetical protein
MKTVVFHAISDIRLKEVAGRRFRTLAAAE